MILSINNLRAVTGQPTPIRNVGIVSLDKSTKHKYIYTAHKLLKILPRNAF